MELVAVSDVADGGLPTLKDLASALLVTDAPEPDLLDRMAALAGAVAAHRREELRQQMLGGLADRIRALLPSAAGDVTARLIEASPNTLSALGSLLDSADSAQASLEKTDADIVTAHGKGDYAAMAALALEADSQKQALASVAGEIESHIVVAPEPAAVTAAEPFSNGAAQEWPEQSADPASPAESAATVEAFPMTPPPVGSIDSPLAAVPAASMDATADQPTAHSERRRLRGLIRQMRATMDEAQ
jgi:hypothetical protein